MKLITLKGWDLHVAEEAWGISAFKKILDRDKSKEKEKALKEMLYVYHFCDIRSDFAIYPDKEKIDILRAELNLPSKWMPDKHIDEAVATYKRYSETTIQRLYKQALKSANDVGNYLEGTEGLLNERDGNGKIVTDIAKITGSLEKVPKIMLMLKNAYREVVQEQIEIEGKKKGSRTMNTFEDGINFDE